MSNLNPADVTVCNALSRSHDAIRAMLEVEIPGPEDEQEDVERMLALFACGLILYRALGRTLGESGHGALRARVEDSINGTEDLIVACAEIARKKRA